MIDALILGACLAWYLTCGLICAARIIVHAAHHGVADRPCTKWVVSVVLALLAIPLWSALLTWMLVVDILRELNHDD